MLLMNNFKQFTDTLRVCMEDVMTTRSFKDPGTAAVKDPVLGSQVIASLAVVSFEWVPELLLFSPSDLVVRKGA